MCDHWETSPTKYTKEKANKEKRKENIHSPPITTHRISSDFFSWAACSQSALPLKSYRGAENNPMWDSRCIDSILSSCTLLPPQESSSSHDLAAYTLSSSFHFHFFTKLCHSRHQLWEINVDFIKICKISEFYGEAFGHLLFVIIFQPLAVNPPHSSMLLHH